jgi:hypothetical protein
MGMKKRKAMARDCREWKVVFEAKVCNGLWCLRRRRRVNNNNNNNNNNNYYYYYYFIGDCWATVGPKLPAPVGDPD